MLELKQVIKQYGSKTALDGVDLKIPQGENVGLFGENGAGKTTLMDFVKETYRYKADRVVQALKDLTGEEEP